MGGTPKLKILQKPKLGSLSGTKPALPSDLCSPPSFPGNHKNANMHVCTANAARLATAFLLESIPGQPVDPSVLVFLNAIIASDMRLAK